METGWQQWRTLGCYITPNNTSTIEDVVAAIISQPHWDELLVTGNFNAYLVDP